ncbi:MAG: hypothetical protein JSW67_13345 [Candidatus Latescibacterota bacterium]|nr:MAG: hypothetical protein JSW67_13345 [Candidatus Latescibacterota bacterium]
MPERLSALRDDASVRRQRQEERRAERFETETMEQLLQPLRELEEGRPAGSWQQYVEELGIPDLQKRSAAGGDAGHAAQRVLEWIFARTSFYMMRQHFALERFAAAATVLRIAAEIRPEAARVWYDLACARARSGEERAPSRRSFAPSTAASTISPASRTIPTSTQFARHLATRRRWRACARPETSHHQEAADRSTPSVL